MLTISHWFTGANSCCKCEHKIVDVLAVVDRVSRHSILHSSMWSVPTVLEPIAIRCEVPASQVATHAHSIMSLLATAGTSTSAKQQGGLTSWLVLHASKVSTCNPHCAGVFRAAACLQLCSLACWHSRQYETSTLRSAYAEDPDFRSLGVNKATNLSKELQFFEKVSSCSQSCTGH